MFPSIPPSTPSFLCTSLTAISGCFTGSPVLVLYTRSPHTPPVMLLESFTYIRAPSFHFLPLCLHVDGWPCVRSFQAWMNIWENIAWHVTGTPTEDVNPTPESILGSDSTTLQSFWDFQIFLDVLLAPQTQYGPTRPPLLFLRSVNGILIRLVTKTRYRAKWPVTPPHLSSLTSNYEVLCTSLKTKQNPGIHPSFYSLYHRPGSEPRCCSPEYLQQVFRSAASPLYHLPTVLLPVTLLKNESSSKIFETTPCRDLQNKGQISKHAIQGSS